MTCIWHWSKVAHPPFNNLKFPVFDRVRQRSVLTGGRSKDNQRPTSRAG
jgi:hypothetical protein